MEVGKKMSNDSKAKGIEKNSTIEKSVAKSKANIVIILYHIVAWTRTNS